MQDKIISAIAAYLEDKMLPHYAAATTNIIGCPSCQDFCQEIATEIAAAIAPLEVGAVDDSRYTDDFLKWREKYFDRKTQVKHFRSKHNGEFRDVKQLERQYERAYNCNSKK